jgi:hypothetical protein
VLKVSTAVVSFLPGGVIELNGGGVGVGVFCSADLLKNASCVSSSFVAVAKAKTTAKKTAN